MVSAANCRKRSTGFDSRWDFYLFINQSILIKLNLFSIQKFPICLIFFRPILKQMERCPVQRVLVVTRRKLTDNRWRVTSGDVTSSLPVTHRWKRNAALMDGPQTELLQHCHLLLVVFKCNSSLAAIAAIMAPRAEILRKKKPVAKLWRDRDIPKTLPNSRRPWNRNQKVSWIAPPISLWQLTVAHPPYKPRNGK